MSCFFSHAGRTAIPALLSVALAAAACNKDGEITLPDSKPRITLDSETGVYAAKIGRAVTITPTVENEGEAAYSWTIDDEVVSTARVFEYVFNEEGRVYVTLRVENRAGYDEKEARIDVNRLAPPVISLIVPPTGLYVLTGREYTFAPEVQNGENARYEWYLDDSSVPVSTEKDYIFMRTQPGDCSLRLTVTNEDGTAEKTVAVHVVDVIPVRIAFIPSSYLADPLVRSVSLGRTLVLRPQVSDAVGPEYAWYVNGVLQEDATQRMFAFTPEKEGEYEVTFRVTDTDESPAAPLSRHITRASSKRITEKTLRVTCYERESERVITTTGQPASLAMDRNNTLWTVTDGGYEGSPYGYEAPSLYRIDAETFSVEKQFRFRKGDSPSEMQLNGTRDTLYWIDRDVWRMPVAGEQLPVRPFLEYKETKYYGLTVDPANGDVYVADAVDYQQQGVVYRYTAKGEPVDEFHVGVAPGAFCWK